MTVVPIHEGHEPDLEGASPAHTAGIITPHLPSSTVPAGPHATSHTGRARPGRLIRSFATFLEELGGGCVRVTGRCLTEREPGPGVLTGAAENPDVTGRDGVRKTTEAVWRRQVPRPRPLNPMTGTAVQTGGPKPGLAGAPGRS